MLELIWFVQVHDYADIFSIHLELFELLMMISKINVSTQFLMKQI